MKKLVATILIAIVVNAICATSALAKPNAERDAQFAAKVKTAIFKLGTGHEARVEMKLRDGTKLKGFVSEAYEDHFVVTDEKTGVAKDVAYPQVKQAKGHNLSTGAKIAIGVGVAVGALILILVVVGPAIIGT